MLQIYLKLTASRLRMVVHKIVPLTLEEDELVKASVGPNSLLTRSVVEKLGQKSIILLAFDGNCPIFFPY